MGKCGPTHQKGRQCEGTQGISTGERLEWCIYKQKNAWGHQNLDEKHGTGPFLGL